MQDNCPSYASKMTIAHLVKQCLNGYLTRGISACSPAASQQFPRFCANTPAVSFALIYAVDTIQSSTVAFTVLSILCNHPEPGPQV